MNNSSYVRAAIVIAMVVTGAGCTKNESSTDGGAPTLNVTSTDDACNVSAVEAPSGNIVFNVTNAGSQVTEFYLLAEDGLRILGEVENIGPGISRKMVVQASPGSYLTACKPGMTGSGIRAKFAVTDSGVVVAAGDEIAPMLETATRQYEVYVKDQTDQLLEATQSFADTYVAGNDDEARATYASTRMFWERIEPVAESFGDLDPRLDLREADLEPGQEWTGWHRIEKDLWPPTEGSAYRATTAERTALANQLVADTRDLRDRVSTLTLTPDMLGNGAKELLDEVATGKVTGEEEIWSHTDLWDFQANVEGARIAFEVLQPVLAIKDPALSTTLATQFAVVQTLLDGHRQGGGFALYTDLSAAEIKALADAVNGLSEPLSNLTAAVLL
jgi:iron uptake system component EfeO